MPIKSFENKLDSKLIQEMDELIKLDVFPNIHSVLIHYKGDLVFESYYNGVDENYGVNLGQVEMTKEYIHDVRSISKIVVAACLGVAIEKGYIKSIKQSIFDFLPNHKTFTKGFKAELTIEHLLTMTSGMVWNEPVPFTDPENSEVLMINSPNPIDFVLSSKIDIEPGTEWRYNGGNTQLLATILENATHLPIDQLANKFLFNPMKITDFEWTKCPASDSPAAASGLRLKSRDLLKLGQLYLNKGLYKNQQIIPEKWVADSVKPQIVRSETEDYGYAFWLWSDSVDGKTESFCAAPGNGDQRIYLDKLKDLIVVVTAGNYDNWDIPNNSYSLLKDYILPSIL